MRSIVLCMGMLVLTAAVSFAEEQPETYDRDEPQMVTDSEGVLILKTIEDYLEAKGGRLELLDRRKGKVVSLQLDRLVADDPDRVVYTRVDRVAVCGECSEIDAEGGETGDKYEVWFVMQRGSPVVARVLETIIKSANGKPMYSWHRDKYGKWTSQLIPDSEE